MDRKKIEVAVRDLLLAIGEDPSREGLKNTPSRVAKMYAEIMSVPELDYTTFSEQEYNDIVLVRNIEFSSTCEHHLMPFYGVAHIAYISKGKIVGLSKLARVVDKYAHRLQVQERMTGQIIDDLVSNLKTPDVMVYLKAVHTCMVARGVKKIATETITIKASGAFKTEEKRQEFHYLLGQHAS